MLETLTSIFYVGIFIGSSTFLLNICKVIAGKYADTYGRKPCILLSSLLFFILAIGFTFSNTVTVMVILRFLYGASFGFSLPLTTSMLSEMVPIRYRGKGLVYF